MSSKFITEADVANFLAEHGLGRKPKPKADNVPTLRFDLPPLTTEQIVESVQNNKPVWRTLEAIYRESIEEKKAKAFERRYAMTPIPEPVFDSEDL